MNKKITLSVFLFSAGLSYGTFAEELRSSANDTTSQVGSPLKEKLASPMRENEEIGPMPSNADMEFPDSRDEQMDAANRPTPPAASPSPSRNAPVVATPAPSDEDSFIGSEGGEMLASSVTLPELLHMSNQFEISLGRLAQEKGSTSEVRAYGQRLERDRRFFDKRLLSIEAALPSDGRPSSIEARRRAITYHTAMQRLQGLSGPEFDRELLSVARSMHDQDIDQIRAGMGELPRDSVFRNHIAKIIPIFEQHSHLTANLQAEMAENLTSL